jgi:hypothetical protein
MSSEDLPGLQDLSVFGRQQSCEDSPPGWPQSEENMSLRVNGRPYTQWPRIAVGRTDALGA